MKKYEPVDSYVIRELSYGEPYQVKVMTIEESFEISGTFSSDTVVIKKVPETCSLLIEQGSEVLKGDPISSCETLKPLDFNGVVKSVVTSGNESIVQLINTDTLVFKASLSEQHQPIDNRTYTSSEGFKISFLKKSNLVNEGKRVYTFKVENDAYLYGMHATFKVQTGEVLKNTFAVERDAIYLNGQKRQAIRIVDENRNVLGEREVVTGMSDGDFIAVNGVNENEHYDLEYGKYQNER